MNSSNYKHGGKWARKPRTVLADSGVADVAEAVDLGHPGADVALHVPDRLHVDSHVAHRLDEENRPKKTGRVKRQKSNQRDIHIDRI